MALSGTSVSMLYTAKARRRQLSYTWLSLPILACVLDVLAPWDRHLMNFDLVLCYWCRSCGLKLQAGVGEHSPSRFYPRELGGARMPSGLGGASTAVALGLYVIPRILIGSCPLLSRVPDAEGPSTAKSPRVLRH